MKMLSTERQRRSCEAESLAVESQRDSVSKPRVARNELPWVTCRLHLNPERVASSRGGRNPVGVVTITIVYPG